MLSLTVSLLAFAGSLDCDRQMERGGAMIMGAIPLVSSRSIVVTRGSPSGEALHSGAAYRHGDKIYVTLDSDEGQAQIRASGGGEGSHDPHRHPHRHPHPHPLMRSHMAQPVLVIYQRTFCFFLACL